MTYGRVKAGRFLRRPNRFIAYADIDGRETVVHVKNTGRCRELLLPGATVYLAESDNPARKTAFDLIAVEKVSKEGASLLINMDAQAPNAVAAEWLPQSGLFSEAAVYRREVTHGNSRFDLYVEDGDRRVFVEVKGVTLERDGTAYFPDAPTERGVKHLLELASAIDEGYEAMVLFVVQMKGICRFCPNDEMHPAFGEALRAADRAGVRILAVDCTVTRDTLACDRLLAVDLNG